MPAKSQSPWDSAKKWIIGATGVLLVIPALVNAGIDVYKAWLNLPRTDSEKANVELFRKYVGKPPTATQPMQIKRDGVIYEVKFSIFDEGDIYVEYGKLTQWFPFPKASPTTISRLSPISSAYAQDLTKIYGPYQQQDKADGSNLQRQRSYANGAVEQMTIDMRTGQITKYSATPPVVTTPPPSTQQSNVIAPFAQIDLDKARLQTAPAPAPTTPVVNATTCVIPKGSCILLQQTPRGTSCNCSTPYGAVPGTAN